jgi:hypothetical protein
VNVVMELWGFIKYGDSLLDSLGNGYLIKRKSCFVQLFCILASVTIKN